MRRQRDPGHVRSPVRVAAGGTCAREAARRRRRDQARGSAAGEEPPLRQHCGEPRDRPLSPRHRARPDRQQAAQPPDRPRRGRARRRMPAVLPGARGGETDSEHPSRRQRLLGLGAHTRAYRPAARYERLEHPAEHR